MVWLRIIAGIVLIVKRFQGWLKNKEQQKIGRDKERLEVADEILKNIKRKKDRRRVPANISWLWHADKRNKTNK